MWRDCCRTSIKLLKTLSVDTDFSSCCVAGPLLPEEKPQQAWDINMNGPD